MKVNIKNKRGQKISGIWYKAKSNKIAILCHGYRSSKESSKAKTLLKIFPKKDINFFAFDFSGRGESDGRFEDSTITKYIEDLDAVIRFFKKKKMKIAVIGSSLGGLISLQRATKGGIDVLALISPVSCFPWRKTEDFSSQKIKEWKKKGYIFTKNKQNEILKISYPFYEDGLKYNDYSVYKKIKNPTIIVHGSKDESVSWEFSKKLTTYIKDLKLIILKGADHGCTRKKDFDRMIKEIVGFVEEKL